MSWNSPWKSLLEKAPHNLPSPTILLHGEDTTNYAYQLAARILKDSAIQEKKWNPDFYESFPYSKGGLHLIDTPRMIQKTLWLEPFHNDYKVYLVHNIDRITLPAIAAFLKILEEPPRHSVFILTATNKQQIPPTILSRCLTLYLGQLKQEINTKSKEVHCLLDILNDRVTFAEIEKLIFNLPNSEKNKTISQEVTRNYLDTLLKIIRDRFVLEHAPFNEQSHLYFPDYLQEIYSLQIYPLHQVIFIVEQALYALDNMTSAISCLHWVILQLRSLKYKSQKTKT